MRIKPGIRGEEATVVDESQTAAAIGSGTVASFATPSLVTLMESAAIAAITPYLDEGESSVGTEISVRHMAASPLGFRVRAEAEVTAVEGKRITFAIVVFDDLEKIAEGTHERYVIDFERFMERVRQKAAKAPNG